MFALRPVRQKKHRSLRAKAIRKLREFARRPDGKNSFKTPFAERLRNARGHFPAGGYADFPHPDIRLRTVSIKVSS